MKSESSTQNHDRKLFDELMHDASVKTGEGYVPFASNLGIIDVSLRGRGRREDRLFASSEFYRKNMRRGLSFLEEDNKGIKILRRGLEKFFDLRSAYLRMLEGNFEDKLPADDEKLFHVIFDDVEETLDMGGTVTIYKTEKANGENAQIGYNEDYDAWVVASKNVSMLVRNKQDVDDYAKCGDSRYAYATLIAYKWLELATKISDLKGFKEGLKNRTLIGEYCGHPKHQHLVEYKEVTIYFFAIVDFHSEKSCCPVHIAQDFFKKYELPMVKITKVKECEYRSELTEALKEVAKSVAESTIQEDAEGAVLYFEAKVGEEREILSLCKTKTLEYRIYRKLREKLKNLIAKDKSPMKPTNDYKKELLTLCSGFTLPKPLQHYLDIAALAFDFVKSNRGVAKGLGLTHRYIDFLNVIKSCHAKSKKPEVKDFKSLLETENPLSEESDLGEEGEEEQKNEIVDFRKRRGAQDKENVGLKSNVSAEQKKDERYYFEDKNKGMKKSDKNTTPGGVEKLIIITPPFYFDKRIESKIEDYARENKMKALFKEEGELKDIRNINVVHHFPPLSHQPKLNQWYLIVGFEKEKKKSTLRKIQSLSETNDLSSNFRESELKYLKSEDKEKVIEELWSEHDLFLEKMKEISFENCTEIRLQKDEKILREIDGIFRKSSCKA